MEEVVTTDTPQRAKVMAGMVSRGERDMNRLLFPHIFCSVCFSAQLPNALKYSVFFSNVAYIIIIYI